MYICIEKEILIFIYLYNYRSKIQIQSKVNYSIVKYSIFTINGCTTL